MKYLILSLFILSTFVCQAQLKTPSDQVLSTKFDLTLKGGISIPLGKYRLLTAESDDKSAAGYGVYSELSGSFTPLPTSPWRISLTLGYMYNPFLAAASKEQYQLSLLEGSSWNSTYGLIGIGFTSNDKFFYAIRASAGIVGYVGGNMTSGMNVLDTMCVQTWVYGFNVAGVVQASFSLGYHFTPKFSMFANVALFYAAGLRTGTVSEERFVVDPQNGLQQPALEQKNKSVQNQSTLFTLNAGLGFRYKLYEEPEEFNYKFNIEENQ